MRKLSVGRLFKSVLLAVLSTLAVMLAATSPVHADSSCVTGDFCVWQHIQSGGWKLEYGPSYGCYTLPSGYWDQVSSYWNRTGHHITAYALQNCSGLGAWDIYGSEYTGSVGWPWNDEMRSFWYE